MHSQHFVPTVILLILAVPPDDSRAVDLMESYARARQVDPSQLAADEAVLAGREKAVQGQALLLPQVAFSGSYSHIDDKSETDLPPALSELIKSESAGKVHQTELQLSQPLYSAKSWAERKQLLQQTELAEINYRQAQQDLMQRVSEAYFAVLLAQDNVRVVRAEKDAVAMQRERAQARFDVGRGKITDLQEAQARYDSVLAREVSAHSTLTLRQAQYQEVTGAAADGLAELRPGFVPQAPLPDDLPTWQRKGMDLNARVLSKQSELDIATAEIDKYRLSGRPTLDLVASYKRTGQNGSLSPTISPDSSRTSVVGLQLNVPLYAGGALNSRLREASHKKLKAEQELSAARRDTRLQVQDAFLAVKTGVSRIAALEQSVLSAQTALEATTLGRDVGNRTELDVLDAQQRLYSAQLDLAQARNDYLLGRIRLASSVGELRESDLRELNGYLAH